MTGDSTIAVLGGANGVSRAVFDGLTSIGVPVVHVDTDALPSADDVARAIRDTAPDGVFGVVDAGLVSRVPHIGELVDLDAEAWAAEAETPMRRALHALQGARRCLDGGGRIVVLLPSLATTGGPGVVAWTAAAEGYRALAKAAARTWGRDGIAVNCVLVPADLVTGESVDRPGLQPPAMGRSVDVHSDVAPVVASLVGSALGAVTGQTIAVDGGVWMTP